MLVRPAHSPAREAGGIGDNSRRAIVQQRDSIDASRRREFLQQEIDASRRRDMLQQEHLKCQQAIDGFAVELSQTSVCEIFALAKTDRATARFNSAFSR